MVLWLLQIFLPFSCDIGGNLVLFVDLPIGAGHPTALYSLHFEHRGCLNSFHLLQIKASLLTYESYTYPSVQG